jgi:hypothetical protein
VKKSVRARLIWWQRRSIHTAKTTSVGVLESGVGQLVLELGLYGGDESGTVRDFFLPSAAVDANP